MNKTTKFIALLMMCMSALTMAADEVIINDVPVECKAVKQIKFDCEQIIIIFDDGTQDTDIASANISLSPVSGVAGVKVYDFTAKVGQDQITIKGLDGKSSIDIFDLNGRTVRHISKPGKDAVTIDISGLSQGIYVLRSGSNVIKFTIK